jgi:hypothetical protein
LTVVVAFVGGFDRLLPVAVDAFGTLFVLVVRRAPFAGTDLARVVDFLVGAVVDTDARVARALPLLVIVFDLLETLATK